MFGKKKQETENNEESFIVELGPQGPSDEREDQLSENELAARKLVGKSMRRIGFAQGLMIGIVIAIIASLLSCLLVMKKNQIGPFSNQETSVSSNASSSGDLLDRATTSKLTALYQYLTEYYYKDLDVEDLQNGLYDGLFEGTGDDYTRYYTAEEYKELQEDTSGTFYGIGAQLSQDQTSKQVSIVSVFEDSGADKAGLQAGDIIESADGYEATDMTLSEFVEKVKGEKDTKVELKILRDGEEMTVKVKRGEVKMTYVATRMLSDSVGYLQISEFTDATTAQYEEGMKKLKEEGAKAVVFDLRDNPGGTINSVTEILDDILPKGTVVYTEDKNGKRTTYTSDAETYEELPIAVLINGNSASASEIFAGAIRDFEYGTLIGTKSFGKGIVQSILPFNDGSAIKLTTATYYTPSGECIHEKGIEPDINLEYEYTGSKTTYQYDKDNQVNKALSVLEEELSK